MGSRPRKERDYEQEYQERISKGRARGLSLSAARGHARFIDIIKSEPVAPVDRKSSLERALSLMKKGVSQKAAAKQFGISTERLRRYQLENTRSRRVGRVWEISDVRPTEVLLASAGELIYVTLPRDAASDVGLYWNQVENFLQTNRTFHLDAFVGKGVRDVKGKLHPYETRPNLLRRLDSAGELQFVDIYRQTEQQP